jgi:hypothetical protein
MLKKRIEPLMNADARGSEKCKVFFQSGVDLRLSAAG